MKNNMEAGKGLVGGHQSWASWSLNTLEQNHRGCYCHSSPCESSQDTLVDDSDLLLQPEPLGSFFLLLVGDGVHKPDRGMTEWGRKHCLVPSSMCSGEAGPSEGHLKYSR